MTLATRSGAHAAGSPDPDLPRNQSTHPHPSALYCHLHLRLPGPRSDSRPACLTRGTAISSCPGAGLERAWSGPGAGLQWPWRLLSAAGPPETRTSATEGLLDSGPGTRTLQKRFNLREIQEIATSKKKDRSDTDCLNVIRILPILAILILMKT